MPYDIVILGDKVADDSGLPGYRADVAIEGDHVLELRPRWSGVVRAEPAA